MKELEWIGSSLEDLKKFPRSVQQEVGFHLFRVQLGDNPPTVKPLKGLRGVFQVRSDYMTDSYRAVYAVKLGEKVFVLHAFKKKSKSGVSTPKAEMEVIRARLKIARAIAKEELR